MGYSGYSGYSGYLRYNYLITALHSHCHLKVAEVIHARTDINFLFENGALVRPILSHKHAHTRTQAHPHTYIHTRTCSTLHAHNQRHTHTHADADRHIRANTHKKPTCTHGGWGWEGERRGRLLWFDNNALRTLADTCKFGSAVRRRAPSAEVGSSSEILNIRLLTTRIIRIIRFLGFLDN
jgi:hypothetical protein